LILRKITRTVATRCYILKLKCTKFDFGWGCAPYPAGGADSVPQDPLAGYKGPTSKGRERRKDGREGQVRVRREGKGPTSKARGREGGGVRKGGGENPPPRTYTPNFVHDETQLECLASGYATDQQKKALM